MKWCTMWLSLHAKKRFFVMIVVFLHSWFLSGRKRFRCTTVHLPRKRARRVHWLQKKMDKLTRGGPICLPAALTRPHVFPFCVWCTWMKLNGVNVGSPPCSLAPSSHFSALRWVHSIYSTLAKKKDRSVFTTCQTCPRKRESGIMWYLPFVFNHIIILLPPCTVLFFLILCLISQRFLCTCSLNPLPFFYLNLCPLWCTSQCGLLQLLFYLDLLPCLCCQEIRQIEQHILL